MVKKSKPQLKSFAGIQEKRDLIAKLSEEIENELKESIAKYGCGRFDFEIEEVDGYKYVKFELSDNIEKLKRGEPVLSHSYFKPVEIKQTFLKRIPESLK